MTMLPGRTRPPALTPLLKSLTRSCSRTSDPYSLGTLWNPSCTDVIIFIMPEVIISYCSPQDVVRMPMGIAVVVSTTPLDGELSTNIRRIEADKWVDSH